MRPQSENDPRIDKGVASWAALESAFWRALDASANGQVFLEHDVRAHAHPTRRDVIRLAAEDLAAKLQTCCAACGTPGFGVVERRAGLPCAECGAPTREICADVLGCLKCGQRETRVRPGQASADPGRCDVCNP